ncbi:class I SAM-dependent methyltransferase [Campylobacter lari]
MEINYYNNLCSEMYDILHNKAPQDELDFYLSYAKKEYKILEPLCGNGRFMIPFLTQGFDIIGIDSSEEMLRKLKQKYPLAQTFCADLLKYNFKEKYDYIFIPSGSISLFTNITECKIVLKNIKNALKKDGVFVFAVDSINTKSYNDDNYKITSSVSTHNGFNLVLKNKSYFDEKTQTQFYPNIYELYDEDKLIKSEYMDFQIHLYRQGEMEDYLKEVGFTKINSYFSFSKTLTNSNQSDFFLYECSH